MAIGDIVTKVDFEKSGLPAKQWVYPIALLLLALIILGQLARRKKQGKSGDAGEEAKATT